MPNTYIVVNDGNVVLERWIGTVTHEELISHERAQLQDRAIKPGAVVLADARQALFETPQEKVHELTDLHGLRENEVRIGKCALLVNNQDYQKAQLLADQAKRLGIPIIVFNTIELACTWLGVDPVRVTDQLRTLRP